VLLESEKTPSELCNLNELGVAKSMLDNFCVTSFTTKLWTTGHNNRCRDAHDCIMVAILARPSAGWTRPHADRRPAGQSMSLTRVSCAS
jgi:hypothetical protein